ncbi:MAG: HAMP domain-containing sensor histidine kinase, partial [Pseudomonadota bacterium]
LAQLGLAVSKINHDLRNMLASAQLLSDRLSTVPDATAQRVTPKLVASLDRAIAFCNDTLQFGRAKEAAPRRQKLQLAKIVNEVGDELGLLSEPFDPTSDASQLSGPTINFDVDIPDDLTVDADPDHLYRVLANMCRNASQVLQATPTTSDGRAPTIWMTAQSENAAVAIRIRDNGPGIPPRARENLFKAFQGSQRQGGTGLGLAIASELISAHGGSVELLETQETGTTFEIVIPDRSDA